MELASARSRATKEGGDLDAMSQRERNFASHDTAAETLQEVRLMTKEANAAPREW